MRIMSRRAAVALLAVGGLAGSAIVASATVISPPTARTGSLVQVGPISDHGYPTWYRDSNGIRLEACWTLDDPLCSTLPDEVPDPDQPVSYPDNFPGEHFYAMAESTVTAGAAGTVDVVMNLEGAWAAEEVVEGDQIVFGRIRIRAKDAADGEYRVVHPYGIDEFAASGGEGINMTQDIGIAPGAFGGAMQSRIGPFLTWDTFGTTGAGAPPAGYVGNPAVDHRIKGSPYGTNSVTVQQKAAGGSWQTIGFNDLFSIQGRLAVNDGVDVQQATYRTMPDGTQVVEVFARSEAGEAIRLIAPELGHKGVTLESDEYEVRTSPTSTHMEGRYFGRFAVKEGVRVTGGADATRIVIQNAGDVPVANKTVSLSDVVTVEQAGYDGDRLTVRAGSSDPGARLTVAGYGDLTGGQASFSGVNAPPHVITVTSTEGGTVTVPLSTSGGFTQPDLPVAVVTATPSRPIVNQPLTLDASASLDATSYAWTTVSVPAQVGGATISLTGVKPSFTPTRPGLYQFSLVAIGGSGPSPAQTIDVQVLGAAATVRAHGGAAQEVRRGASVTLDGSLSVGAAGYLWEQIPNAEGQAIPLDHVVPLSDATAVRPTFRFPLMALPAAPGPNNTYTSVPATPLRFRLTVTGVDGTTTATHETVVRPAAETLTVAEARYRTRGEWRVSGTSSLLAGQRVAIVVGSRFAVNGAPAISSARGPVVGFATVDALGAWSYVGTGPNPATTTPLGTTVTAVSQQGAQAISGVTTTG